MSEHLDTDLEDAWREHRRALLDVAYRLLGSVAEAEDAVQEAFARLMRADRDAIDDLRGWLVVVVSRICLDQLRSARVRREAYVGPWLPDPVVIAPAPDADPADRVTLDESVRLALLVVLEQLSPPERVALVLHDVFHLSFEEVGRIVGRSPAACRQLASRARRRVDEQEPAARFSVDREREAAVAERFLAAARDGDLAGLTAVLDPGVVLRADSGGLVQAPRRPISGRDKLVKIVARGLALTPGMRMRAAWVNGGPGLVAHDGEGRLVAVAAFVVEEDRIVEVDLLGNPERLARLDVPAA